MRRYRSDEESLEQISVISWASFNQKLKKRLLHIANQRKCSPQQGLKLKRMGVRAGVSDLFLAWPVGEYAGAWIEMKSRDGKLTPAQKEFLEDMKEAGYFTAVCKSFEEAKYVIEGYLTSKFVFDIDEI